MQIQVYKRLLARNAATAQDNRRRLDEHGVVAFNIMGSPGCGKTSLLEQVIPRLNGVRCAVLVGDLATTRDAQRVARLGVPAAQLLTEGGCHLEARLVHEALDGLDLGALDCIFVENVGNLVCPANFNIGEHHRVAVLSVAEGPDKPLKYPFMFQRCEAIVINKVDLLPWCRFDVDEARRDLRGLNESAAIFPLSCTDGTGIADWAGWIQNTIAGRTPRSNADPLIA